MDDIFISYSRKDKAFAARLHEALKARQREAWVDLEDIPPTAEWREKIKAGIEGARAFVFVLSPDSMASPECLKEVDYAAASHKRLIPVVCRGVDAQTVPEALGCLNWISMQEQDDFEKQVDLLLIAVDTDLEWVDAHTNLLEKSTEWDRKGREKSLLLRGGELRKAEDWQVESGGKEPKPTELMGQFILASRKGETSRQRRLLAGVGLALVVAVTLAIVAFFQYREADRRGKIALSRQLAAQSKSLLGKERLDKALLLSLAAGRVQETLEAKSSLLSALMHEPYPLSFLHGHTKRIRTLAFSPDGKTLASGSSDKTIILWDVAARQPLGSPLTGHSADRTSAVFSPDGKILASASEDKTIILWDLAAGKPLGPALQGHSDTVFSLAFSPDGKLLASGAKGTLILWDMNANPPLGRPLAGHTSFVSALAFSPDGKILASGDNLKIIFWEAATTQPLGPPLAHPGWVNSLAFSPDSKTLTSVHQENEVIRWEVAGGKELSRFGLGSSPAVLTSAAFSANVSMLASGRLDRTFTLWDVKKQRPSVAPLTSHAHPVDAVAFSPDGQTLASGSRDGDIILWDLSGTQVLGKTILPFRDEEISNGKVTGRFSSVAVSPDGKILVQINREKSVIRKDQITKFLESVAGLSGDDKPSAEDISKAKSVLTAGLVAKEKDPAITLRDLTTREPLGPPLPGLNDAKEFSKVFFSPDGKFLATVKDDTTILVWETATQKLLESPAEGNGVKVWSLAFSPDGRILAAGQDDKKIVLRELPSLKPLDKPFTGHTSGVFTLAFSLDGKTLASGDGKKTILFWDVATGRALSPPLAYHSLAMESLAFSPDGRILASGSGDQSIILWDVASHRPLGPPLTGHNFGVKSVGFSPDGKTLASASHEGSIILWDLATRLPLGPPLKGQTGADYLFFYPDGKTLISGSKYKTIQWDMAPEIWKSRACRIANRNLTREEWARYLGDEPYCKTCPNLPEPEEEKEAK
ncbi:MAG: TIR domain-containing protein [Desulfomonile tiedjei]|nr:TIR domain-containing protein [Desulfomonile tiedjei]